MPEPEIYRVLMDERWDLEDLFGFPRAYSQVYDFIYCFDSEQTPRNQKRIDRALEEYPWKGGYSYLNLYTVLHFQVPAEDRPEIEAIRYSSPGWMDILLQVDVAIQIARSVSILLATGVVGAEAIKRMDKVRLDIARQRLQQKADDAKLTKEQVRELNETAEELARTIGFNSLRSLQQRTNDPELTVKILFAHYRRLKDLSDYVQSGKIGLPENLPRQNDADVPA